ncbi:MAG: hypothetical protein AAGD23_11625, partial [Pseudomonadota bacterium]
RGLPHHDPAESGSVTDDYDAADNSRKSFTLALAAIREQHIRNGEIEPTNEQERRWAAEGPKPTEGRD